jgi:DnaK suppressor protein
VCVAPTGANKNGRAKLLDGLEEQQMTKTELKAFKAILKARQVELAQVMRKRDGIAIEKTPDALDEVQLATERDLATRNLERDSKLLRSVRQALSRIDEGTYGSCLDCEEEIGAKRLKALPWTPLCINCQKQADYNRELGVEQHESLLVNAA